MHLFVLSNCSTDRYNMCDCLCKVLIVIARVWTGPHPFRVTTCPLKEKAEDSNLILETGMLAGGKGPSESQGYYRIAS